MNTPITPPLSLARRLLYFAALIALLSSSMTFAAEPIPQTREVTLSALGYADGLALLQESGATTLYFPAPQDAALADAKVLLHVSGALLAGTDGFMELLVNGQQRATVLLSPENLQSGFDYAVPLVARDFRDAFLALTVRNHFDSGRSKCDEQDSGAFLNISADSALSYALPKGRPTSVRGWMSTLPAEVTIAVQGDTPAALKSAWFIADEIVHTARTVRFAVGLENPDAQVYIVDSAPDLPAGADALAPLQLITRGDDMLLLVRAGDDVALAAQGWRPLLIHATAQSAELRMQTRNGANNAVGLVDLGFDSRPQEAAPAVEWHVSLDERRLPPGREARRAQLVIVAAPGMRAESALMATYLDGRLLQTDRLLANGRPERVLVDLQNQRGTDLRVLVRYERDKEECARRAGLPVQILPESFIELDAGSGTPERFDKLGASWRPGMRVRYDRSLPVSARLAILTSLSGRFGLSPQLLELVPSSVVANGTQDRDLLWLSKTQPPGWLGPVRVDQGHFRVEDARGRRVLDSAEIPDLSVWQIVRNAGNRALWIHPSSTDPTLSRPFALPLDASDVAFVSNDQVLLQLNTAEAQLAGIVFPEYQGWWTYVGEYRSWLFFAAWLGVTMMVVALYRRLRAQRR